MSTLRTRESRFSRVDSISNEIKALKIKSKSRLKSALTKSPILNSGEEAILGVPLGESVVLKDVFLDQFGFSVEFHGSREGQDPDAVVYSLDPSNDVLNGEVRVVSLTDSRDIKNVTSRDENDRSLIFIKVINNSADAKAVTVRVTYFDLSEAVYNSVYPTVSVSSRIAPLIVPIIKTPIPGFVLRGILNEYSPDPVPRLVDPTLYGSYNQTVPDDPSQGLLVTSSSVKDGSWIKALKLSRDFQPEGIYKVYFKVLGPSSPEYDRFKKYNVDLTSLPSSSELTVKLKDSVNDYSTSVTVGTIPADYNLLSTQMLIFEIENGKFKSNPFITPSDEDRTSSL